ncbi:ATP-binding protein [uncultured Bacteroides sp.]|uniref:ATP-binding protein n=1 Tax=uncultured Bacteroides sp. TaxID=162156 RepID=UPI00280A7A72|nr:ATP-binding protein [uncultured Bacteroides sp.]
MKRIITILSLALFCLCTQTYAQNRADELMKQAQESLAKKEYIKARYLFLQAYNSFASQEKYAPAVECGVNASALYHRENYYKEAFELLRSAEQLVGSGEQKLKKSLPDLRFRINKERLQMYIDIKNPTRAKEQLNKLAETAKAAGNDSLSNDFLYTQANYYYTFGMNTQGDSAFRKLIERYKQQKNYAKVDECYKKLIDIARKANNATLVARTYDKYIVWADSVKALAAQDKLNILKNKYDGSLATIQEKDDSLSAKQYIIIGLCILTAVLAAALVIGAIVLLRFVMLTRKQKKAIDTANEHNELKSRFIRNISAQMEPTLDTLDPELPGVQALRTFSSHIQELSELENSLSEPYEVQEKNISAFCESIMDKIRNKVQEDVSLTVNAPKLNVKISPEHLERILLHLLENSAEYTPAGGKIWLDFKKRGAHTHQFIISDTGCGIPEAQRENIFKPFTEIKNLTQGDGLGLPICSLIATKMNGSLTLDSSYTKGARFILELHA